jgi:hypothetical protein
MTSRLETLTARRIALQADCVQQRNEIQQLYGKIGDRVARVDRVVDAARSLAPVIIAGSVAVLFAFGPGRAFRLLRRSLTTVVYASEALRLLR